MADIEERLEKLRAERGEYFDEGDMLSWYYLHGRIEYLGGVAPAKCIVDKFTEARRMGWLDEQAEQDEYSG